VKKKKKTKDALDKIAFIRFGKNTFF